MRRLAALATLIAAAACAPDATPPVREVVTPTLVRAANAAYLGIHDGGPVVLAAGRFEDAERRVTAGLAERMHATGDLDGDGIEDLVVIVWESTGGSGTYSYVAAFTAADDPAAPVRAARVGDRVKYRAIAVEDGRVRLDVLQAGPEDAMCCPGELATRRWTWDPAGHALVEQPVEDPVERLSLAAVAGTWRLSAWNLDEPAPGELEVTLNIAGGRASGSSGCNRYTGGATEGAASPGQVTFGPLAGTRMACPGPAMAIEARYLGVLGQAERFGFHLGQLALDYRTEDGGMALLLFEALPEASTPAP